MANKEISIVKDYWDWQSERIQITTGFFVASASLILVWLLSDSNLTSSISHEYGFALVTIYDATQNTAFHNELNSLSFMFLTIPRLVIHLFTSCFVGLIALEISKIYGNRWGVIHSVWTTLLYMICPTTVTLMYAGDGIFILLGALFAALALYAELRFRYLNEDFYLISSVVFLALSLSLDLVAGLQGLFGILLSRLLLVKVKVKNFNRKLTYSYLALLLPSLLVVMQNGGLRAGHFSIEQTAQLLNKVINSPEHLIAHTKMLVILITGSLCVLGVTTTIRVLVGTLWLRPLFYLIAWTLICFITASFYIGGNHYLKDSSVIVASLAFYCSMPIAILLSFIALPAIDAVNKPISITMTCLGCFILSILFMFWGSEMNRTLEKQVEMQKDFKEFRTIASQISLSFPNKSVFLIGLPKTVNDFVNSHKMKLTPMRQDKVFNATKPRRKNALTYVNSLTTQKKAWTKNDSPVYLVWNDQRKTFLPIHHNGRYNFSFIACSLKNLDLEIEPHDTPILKQDSFTRTNFGLPLVEFGNSDITLVAGKTPIVVWLPLVDLNPSLCQKLVIDAKLSDNGFSNTTKVSKLKFLWLPKNESIPYESDLVKSGPELLTNNINREENWLGKTSIRKIGIKLEPGEYTCRIKKMTIGVNDKKDSL